MARRTALDEFKELVVNTVMEYDGGCLDGKINFLAELGLEPPVKEATFTINVKWPGNASSGDVYEFLRRCLDEADAYTMSQYDMCGEENGDGVEFIIE